MQIINGKLIMMEGTRCDRQNEDVTHDGLHRC
jgi:hypothetical protein